MLISELIFVIMFLAKALNTINNVNENYENVCFFSLSSGGPREEDIPRNTYCCILATTSYQTSQVKECWCDVGENGVNWPFFRIRYISKLKTHFCTLSTLKGGAFILLSWDVNLK